MAGWNFYLDGARWVGSRLLDHNDYNFHNFSPRRACDGSSSAVEHPTLDTGVLGSILVPTDNHWRVPSLRPNTLHWCRNCLVELVFLQLCVVPSLGSVQLQIGQDGLIHPLEITSACSNELVLMITEGQGLTWSYQVGQACKVKVQSWEMFHRLRLEWQIYGDWPTYHKKVPVDTRRKQCTYSTGPFPLLAAPPVW